MDGHSGCERYPYLSQWPSLLLPTPSMGKVTPTAYWAEGLAVMHVPPSSEFLSHGEATAQRQRRESRRGPDSLVFLLYFWSPGPD